MSYGLRLLTPPVGEPLTYQECKHQLSLCHDEDVYWLEQELIPAARVAAERMTSRQFLTATWTLELENFPQSSQGILLPRGMFQSVDAIRYVDHDFVDQTLPVGEVYAKGPTDLKRIIYLGGETSPQTWPNAERVEIDFTCGYGTARTDIPADIRNAMRMLVTHYFRAGREPVAVRAYVTEVPETAKHILARRALGEYFETFDPTSFDYASAA